MDELTSTAYYFNDRALTSSLVNIANSRFVLDGLRFPIVGANNYYLAYASPNMRAAVLRLARQMGLNVLRAWAFLDCGAAKPGAVPPGAWRGVYFQYWNEETQSPVIDDGANGLVRLDQLIADAEQSGIRLILPLVNHWPDFGGTDRYVQWFSKERTGRRRDLARARKRCGGDPLCAFTGEPSPDRFYRDESLRAAYKSYVRQILTRCNSVTKRLYMDEPAILAWELANEPECPTRDGCTVLLEWVREMSDWVKQHDSRHLVAVGDQGYFNGGRGHLYDGSHGVDFEALLQISSIDFGTFHLYPQHWDEFDPIPFGIQWIDQHLETAAKLGKPAILEEYGVKVEMNNQLPPGLDRSLIYNSWFRAIADRGGAGHLVWMIASNDDDGTLYKDYDGFTLYDANDAPAIYACGHVGRQE